jgi:hypothetical protein
MDIRLMSSGEKLGRQLAIACAGVDSEKSR